jgi:hypothetical protein
MYYCSAACNLAAEAAKLADLLTNGSADLIECQFAQVRASYAKCKGAHAALQAECVDQDQLGNSPASAAAKDRIRMTEDLMAMI